MRTDRHDKGNTVSFRYLCERAQMGWLYVTQ